MHTTSVTPARRRRRTPVAPTPAAMLGASTGPLPAGSRRLLPVQRGDQGISASERAHAERSIARLFRAPGIDMIATYDQERGTYEIRSRTGVLRWERWATPTGDVRYVIVEQSGDNPIPSVDGTILRTMEEEVAAAGGAVGHVPKERNSYPDILQRISQLFDHRRTADFVYIPTTGGDPNHPGSGSHGIPDMVQSRAPLVIAGPGIARGASIDTLVRHEDLAPTIADLLGVRHVTGTNATGVQRTQLLKWQDGSSRAAALVDARSGATARGSAERALIFTVDGMSQTAMLDEIKRGNLPNMQRIINAGTTFTNGTLATYPTVTWANHTTLLTGAAPGHSGIVNNSWYDRERSREQLITDGSFRNSFKTSRFLERGVETLYEAVKRTFPSATTIAINQPAGRGADMSVLDLKGFAGWIPKLPRIVSEFVRGWNARDHTMRNDPEWRKNTPMDLLATSLGAAYFGSKNAPKLGVVEFTLTDNQGHEHGPHHPDARRAMRQVDAYVGAVLNALERSGNARSTAIVLTADHGMGTQETDVAKTGGWFEAQDESAVDGTKTVHSTRFVYIKNVQWSLVGAAPATGTRGEVAVRVVNDDVDTSGVRPSVAGARVTITDADGGTWHGVTGADGVVRMDVTPGRGPLRIEIEHAEFSRETGTIPLG